MLIPICAHLSIANIHLCYKLARLKFNTDEHRFPQMDKDANNECSFPSVLICGYPEFICVRSLRECPSTQMNTDYLSLLVPNIPWGKSTRSFLGLCCPP